MNTVPDITIDQDSTIPQIGLGLWKVKDQAQFKTMFDAAVAAGYRHFDTAQAYDNEAYLGEAWRGSRLDRSEIFVTTKIAVEHFGYRKAQSSFEESLKNLQTEYVDLLLLHFPVPVLRRKSWKALEEIQAAGKAKHIGVSNYTIRHLEGLKKYGNVQPAVNQVELHVFLQQPELVKYCQDNGITLEAYSPLAHARETSDQVVNEIAKKHGKSYAQIMLRWCIEQGCVVLPKSVTPSRIQENINIFDFSFEADDKAALIKLDRDLRTCWSPVHVP